MSFRITVNTHARTNTSMHTKTDPCPSTDYTAVLRIAPVSFACLGPTVRRYRYAYGRTACRRWPLGCDKHGTVYLGHTLRFAMCEMQRVRPDVLPVLVVCRGRITERTRSPSPASSPDVFTRDLDCEAPPDEAGVVS